MVLRNFLVVLFLCSSQLGFAKISPPTLQKQINDFLRPFVEDDRFSGTVLVGEGDNIIVNRGYGKANREWNIMNRRRDKFRIASLTKAMMAAATLSLRDSGQLTLDDTVGQYIANYPIASNVTIRQLLNHTNGIPDYTLFPDFPVFQRESFTTSTLIDKFRNLPLEFTPGTQFSFTNSGYIVLTAILESVTGQSLSDLLDSLVFSPIPLMNTALDDEDLIFNRRVSGYMRTEDPVNPVLNAFFIDMSVASGAAGAISTTADYFRFLRGLVNGTLLAPASVTEMFTSGLGDYGLGVRVGTNPTVGTFIWHDGAINGFFTSFRLYVSDDVSLVVLANIMDLAYFTQVLPGLENIVISNI